jgi:hypothetical protein
MINNFHNIFILGGHELSFSYFLKITQAKKEKRIDYHNIYFIEPSSTSYAHQELIKLGFNPKDYIISKTYSDFILTSDVRRETCDALIPDHTAKHTMLQAYMALAKTHNPKLSPIDMDIDLPFIKKLEQDTIWAMSYATWTCPLYCDEPTICPHTKTKRTWDLDKIRIDESMGRGVVGIFSCQPLVDEIVYISVDSIAENIQEFQNQLKRNPPKDVYVFTHSHCHGILGKFCC